MEELIGKKVSIFLQTNTGLISSKGDVLEVSDKFIKLQTSNNVIYVAIQFIKTITLLNNQNIER